jgi:glutamyl-Q tRNA(Asp) synthetase
LTVGGDRRPADPILAPTEARERSPAAASREYPAQAGYQCPARAGHQYVGRFAPSPTGDLHLGSLLAAVGSFLDARHHGGRWLVRIEDLDTSRNVPGSADRILRTLDGFGLHWDGPVEYQSRRIPLYLAALHNLEAAGRTFQCSCSRKDLAGSDTHYPGTCRNGPTRDGPSATRFRMEDSFLVLFDDRVQGTCYLDEIDSSDFVIRRKDGIIAYQLAVVVDDDAQHVSDVVRGADLLPSTGWQIALQRALGKRTPHYAHLPLVVEQTHEKLGKSRHAVPVDPAAATPLLANVLRMLNHAPPPELENDKPRLLLEWAARNWRLDRFHGLRTVTARDTPLAK